MTKNLIVHISKTSLAGAPIRLVNALNKYSSYQARLINYYPLTTDEGVYFHHEDLNFQTDKEKCIDLIKKADIIHFHHYFDLKTNPFLVDFNKATKPGCKFIRHFHSTKSLYACRIDYQRNYKNDKLQKIVIPHCAERTFLELPIVPNILPINDELYLPKKTNNEKTVVVFSASNKNSYKEHRWETKGYSEVSKKLIELSKKYNFEYVEINGLSIDEAMKIKQNSDIVIGDIVTGSYHLTELEGLSLGKPTLTFVDPRTMMTCLNVFKTKDVPFVNTNLNNLEFVLKELLSNIDLRNEIGAFSRNWIEKYYREEKLIKIFTDVYDKLLNDIEIKRKDCDKFPNAKEFLYNKCYDLYWENCIKEV